MEKLQYFHDTYVWFTPLIVVLVIWELIWKLIALWKAARNHHLVWFVCLGILNTLGILSMAYIFYFSKPTTEEKSI
jgi:uncharacterized membrane protein